MCLVLEEIMSALAMVQVLWLHIAALHCTERFHSRNTYSVLNDLGSRNAVNPRISILGNISCQPALPPGAIYKWLEFFQPIFRARHTPAHAWYEACIKNTRYGTCQIIYILMYLAPAGVLCLAHALSRACMKKGCNIKGISEAFVKSIVQLLGSST